MISFKDKAIVIFGATSAIAQEVAKLLAMDGANILLIARDEVKLSTIARDLEVCSGKTIKCLTTDLSDLGNHRKILESIASFSPIIDLVLVAHGVLGNQEEMNKDFAAVNSLFCTNFLSAVSLLTPLANKLEKQQTGTIAVISSVAGDRGRPTNYIYASSKAALNCFLSGLRARLHNSKVKVLTIKPGFVSTPMTAHLQQNFLFAKSDQVGLGIYRAICRGKDVVYLPWFWRYIMLIIIHLPEFIFKRTRF